MDQIAPPTVHALVGLPAAGKTTCARRIATELPAVRFSLDEWMLRLYRLGFDDEEYVRLLPGCRDLMLDVASEVLAARVDVVLDWNHWSPEKRSTSASWAAAHGAEFVVHYVATSRDDARAQLDRRNAAGDAHSHVIDAEGLDQALMYFAPPLDDEGYQICVHDSREG